MNWNKIVWLALLLFVAQVVVGLAEGVFSSADSGTTWLLAGHAASFIACSTIFALFATRNPPRPFAHTLLALVLQAILSVVFSGALAIWLGSMPWSWVSVAMEWAVLVAALVAGTSVGIRLRHSARRPADA